MKNGKKLLKRIIKITTEKGKKITKLNDKITGKNGKNS